jgi:hypothetical protein
MPTALFGVDFSGAIDAGRKIWIARLERDDCSLRVISVTRLKDLMPGACDRTTALASLVEFMRSQPEGLFGCDFPFSLPSSLLSSRNWPDFLEDFVQVYPSPDALYEAGRQAGHPRRACDSHARTPFAPTNLRLFRQSWHGISGVLRPLVLSGDAAAIPMQSRKSASRVMMEVCPASTLKALKLYRPYKGSGSDRLAARQRLVHWLSKTGLSFMCDPLPVISEPEGDALDSVLAAFAVARAISAGELDAPPSADAIDEGAVFGCARLR